MKRAIVLLLMLLLSAAAHAQTDTPTVSTSPSIFATVEAGQMTRFDYIVTAGSVHTANLLTLILFSVWGMFFFGVFVYLRMRQS